jgi:hypothetical protein
MRTEQEIKNKIADFENYDYQAQGWRDSNDPIPVSQVVSLLALLLKWSLGEDITASFCHKHQIVYSCTLLNLTIARMTDKSQCPECQKEENHG